MHFPEFGAPHPRNNLREMWGLPMFDIADAAAGLAEIRACRETCPYRYVRVSAYDASYGRQTTALSFIVHRPPTSPASAWTARRPATAAPATP
jgi:ribulose-bisphosphate carboxylase small chain